MPFLAVLCLVFIIGFWPLYVCPSTPEQFRDRNILVDDECYQDILDRGFIKHFTEPKQEESQ